MHICDLYSAGDKQAPPPKIVLLLHSDYVHIIQMIIYLPKIECKYRFVAHGFLMIIIRFFLSLLDNFRFVSGT